MNTTAMRQDLTSHGAANMALRWIAYATGRLSMFAARRRAMRT